MYFSMLIPKNKKLMIILSCALLVCVIIGCILYFALSKTTDANKQNEPSDAQIADVKGPDEETDKSETNVPADVPNANVPNINEGNGPVNIQNGDDLVGKIDKFNSLNDGDPEKEKIRKELEDLFAYAEGTTLN